MIGQDCGLKGEGTVRLKEGSEEQAKILFMFVGKPGEIKRLFVVLKRAITENEEQVSIFLQCSSLRRLV
jgi:hypothetical protein